jgi:hypothetical protein
MQFKVQRMKARTNSISITAFFTLLLIAFMMGINHVAARLAFNNGLDVATAVACRSLVTALVVGVLIGFARSIALRHCLHQRVLAAVYVIFLGNRPIR